MKELISFLVLLIFLSQTAFSCTAVYVNKGDTRLIGRTMDWPSGDTDIFFNKAGVNKTAASLQDRSTPIKWTSKYNSVTFDLKVKFNLIAKLYIWLKRIQTSAPSCGMNEKGLWGGSLWIHPPPAVIYPKDDGRAAINDWQVLEYALDTSANVAEAINNIKKIRVSGFKEAGFETDLHWFFADRSGDSAIIEFPDGKMKIHRDPKPAVMANSFYEHENGYLKTFKGYGGTKAISLEGGEMTSENRFVFAADSLNKVLRATKITPADIFWVMRFVTQTNVRHMSTSQSITQWTAVYDLNNRTMSWNTRKDPKVRSIDLKKKDFSGKTNMIDLGL